MDLACPKCRSDNTQKLSLAVEGGTFSSKARTLGVGASGAGVGGMVASTKGSSTSKLAENYAAPAKATVISDGLLIIFLAFIISLFAGEMALIIGCGIAGLRAIFGWKYNFTDFHRDLAEWNSKYLCLRCSDVFIPAPHDTDGRSVVEASPATLADGR